MKEWYNEIVPANTVGTNKITAPLKYLGTIFKTLVYIPFIHYGVSLAKLAGSCVITNAKKTQNLQCRKL